MVFSVVLISYGFCKFGFIKVFFVEVNRIGFYRFVRLLSYYCYDIIGIYVVI